MLLRDAELLVQTRSPPAALGCGAAAPRGGGCGTPAGAEMAGGEEQAGWLNAPRRVKS